jgi:hypothetical protein
VHSGPLRCARILNVKDVRRIHPDDPALHLEPLKRVAAEAFRYLIGVHVEPESECLVIVTAEHDHAGHGESYVVARTIWIAYRQARGGFTGCWGET